LAAPRRLTTQARALHRACLILRGIPALAAELRVTERDLRAWLEGDEEPPESAFLAAVEIILLELEGASEAN
jgi:hypothetical protein